MSAKSSISRRGLLGGMGVASAGAGAPQVEAIVHGEIGLLA